MTWIYFVVWFLCLPACSWQVVSEPVVHGQVQSPQYPKPYPPNLMRQWDLTVPEGFQIQLSLTHMDIKTSDGCNEDSLTVLYNQAVLRKFCGQKGKERVLSPGNRLTLLFQTSDSNSELQQHIGFSGTYEAIEVKCSHPGNVVNGRVTPVLTEYSYRDHVRVACNQGYRMMASCKELKTFSATCQSNGQWDPPMPECHSTSIYCGQPEPLVNGGVTLLSGIQNQYCSVIQYHCNEPFYSLAGDLKVTFTCEANGKWKSNHNSAVTPTCVPVCGQPTKRIFDYERIIGGSEAPEDSIPWQVLVSIENRGLARGGGMVIADRWILTAAHIATLDKITESKESVKIYMGLTNNTLRRASPVFAASVHVHPEYNNSRYGNSYNNDIALIKLRDPIMFNASVMPICLPAEGATYDTGVMGLVSGYGTVNVAGRRSSKNLNYVPLPVVDQETCSNSFRSLENTMGNLPSLTNNMFCAGLPEGGKDSCSGDGGGPFALTDNGTFWAAGIVSWGVDCGRQGTYTVYTKVANYLGWIKKTMHEN